MKASQLEYSFRILTLRFVVASYSSLYLLSSIKMLSLCHLVFLVTPKILPTCVVPGKSYLMESYKTHIFQNAYIFSSKIVRILRQGLNLTHLIHFVSNIGLILAARMKGHMKTRFVANLHALCVSCFRDRILDRATISCRSSLGIVGVKLVLNLWVWVHFQINMCNTLFWNHFCFSLGIFGFKCIC